MHRFRKFALRIIILTLVFLAGFTLGWFIRLLNSDFGSPFVAIKKITNRELPLDKYAIGRLGTFPLKTSKLQIKEKIDDSDSYSSYLFTYEATNPGRGGLISGQINLPHNVSSDQKVIIMVRGYVPLDAYETGVGTRAGADIFAKNGYITIAPDFLGYGQSDPEPEDSWEARFVKPVHLLELIKSVEGSDFRNISCEADLLETDCNTAHQIPPDISLGIWAHSNGGQIALTALEARGEGIPTTLWAPVTSPFPYSILFFSDENDDEGKVSRRWLAQFEQDYDASRFSLTKHLDKLDGPIIIHHGTLDEAALISWSREFEDKVEIENEIREVSDGEKEPIDLKLYVYPGADHNMRPSWNEVIAKDLEFFSQQL